MRVLLASLGPDDRHSGLGKWTQCVAEALRQRGHQVSVWSGEDHPAIRRIGRLSFLLYPVALAARLVVRRTAFDVVVVHEPGGLCYALLRRALRTLPPMVLMCHNVESKVYRVMREAAGRGYARMLPWSRITIPFLRLPLSDGAIRLADHVVCLSDEDVSYVTTALGVPPVRVTRSANGVEEKHFVARTASAEGRRVLFVGGWLDVKGRRLLPPIWAAVRARVPDARLTIVGPVLPATAVRADFAPEDRESVSVLSTVPAAEMIARYVEHDLFLMPSLTEGTSLALMEAMAAGLPAVAARTGGLPDVVTHDVDGLLFAPYDVAEAASHVVRLLRDGSTAGRLGEAGRSRARALTWAASAERLENAMARAGAPRDASA